MDVRSRIDERFEGRVEVVVESGKTQ